MSVQRCDSFYCLILSRWFADIWENIEYTYSTYQSCFVAVMPLTKYNTCTFTHFLSPLTLFSLQLLAISLHLLSLSLYLTVRHSISRLGETHMGELPAGMPARAPNHGALTLSPSVSASPVYCRFANRTIQMVSSLLPPWPPTLATSEGQRESLCDLWFSTVHHRAPPSLIFRIG